MTIYDVKFYGVHYPNMFRGTHVILSQSQDEVYEKAPEHFRFEATVLKNFGSKKDVLQLCFLRGDVEYVTLYEPGMYLEEGEWKYTKNREVAKAFLKEYEKLQPDKKADKQTNLFDITFYGLYENWGVSQPKVAISLSEASLRGNNAFTSNSIMFTAKILKEYKGNKYVVRIVTASNAYYVPLFNGKIFYDAETGKWVECGESPIPNKIIKCYIKYLNE